MCPEHSVNAFSFLRSKAVVADGRPACDRLGAMQGMPTFSSATALTRLDALEAELHQLRTQDAQAQQFQQGLVCGKPFCCPSILVVSRDQKCWLP